MGQVHVLAQYRADTGKPIAQPQRAVPRTHWTPQDVQVALRDADAGQLINAADLVEQLLTDDRISGVMSTRTLGMLGLPLTFEGAQPLVDALAGPSGTDGDWHAMHPEAELASLMAWGITLGVGVAQRVPVRRAMGKRQLHRLRVWHPRWLSFEWHGVEGESLGQWKIHTRDGQRVITPGDGEWIIYAPYGGERPWSRGLWRTLAFSWILKRFALLDRSRHLEVLGSPIRAGTAPLGATEGQRRRWQSQLRTLSRDSAIVMPDGYKLELVEAKGNSWEMYDSQVNWADRAATIAIAGQIVTTEGSTGFAEGAAQDAIRRELVRFTGRTVSETLRAQSLRPWAALNFPRERAPSPRWDSESSAERLERARSMISLGEAIGRMDAALASSGVRMDTAALAQRYDLPLVQLPETTKSPTVTMAPTDVVNFVTVNEVRASAGLGPLRQPDGAEDPQGWESAGVYKARIEADRAKAVAAAAADDAGDGSESARATQEREAAQAESP